MKKLLAISLLLLSCRLHAGIESGQKSPRSFHIYEVKPDKTVHPKECRISFLFSVYAGKLPPAKIKMAYNKTEITVSPDSDGNVVLTVPSGNTVFRFFLDESHYEITSDTVQVSGGSSAKAAVTFISSVEPVICDKPVIYVYSDTAQQVSVQLNTGGRLGFTYPAYQDGWVFRTDARGQLLMKGRQYDYLFWEGTAEVDQSAAAFSEGFLAGRDSLAGFFEKQLGAMGLNPSETQDFITYWVPLMQQHESVYLHFAFNEEYDRIATLNVQPSPDHSFRLFLLWSDATGLDAKKLRPQALPSFQRGGLTLVEWGGAKMSRIPLQLK